MVHTLTLDLNKRSLAEADRSREAHFRYGRYTGLILALIVETIGRSSIDIPLGGQDRSS